MTGPEEDVTNETAKADKDCKNMVLRKEIVDGRVSRIKNIGRRNTDISRYRLNRNNHVITRHLFVPR